jgi:hypothetical protein
MDHSGDSRHFFDSAEPEATLRAETLFNDLTAKGYTAAVRTGVGEVTRLGKFDPTAEETLFFPRLVGG